MKGKITRIFEDRGYGFIAGEDGQDYFFHISTFAPNIKIGDLNTGLEVQFKKKMDKDGLKAINCKITDRNFLREGYLKEYLIENVLIAPSKLEGYDEFCDNVQAYALRLRDGKVTTSMIRKLYARIIAAENVMDLKLLRPQFAYTAGRNEKNKRLKEFMEILDTIVKSMDVNDRDDELNNFKQFMEAIVAYRKFVGDD